ncbi:metalloregulator ArsR/SmtB family transcription factor [Phenylobacterium sp.]|jgi:DNA-binding transcriptional ArsR family regulator|uniref:ArsR/SmtB family transcription factor n=1 Tax=Phenylobacterium sp. TaxID=1871053 RepID=UPI002F41BB18
MLQPQADIFRTLADPTRRGLFERLARADSLSVRSLTEGAAVSQPAVSQHLKVLREAGLVVEQKVGRNVFYSVEPRGLAPLIDWMALYAVFWRDRFERLEDVLNRMDQ